MPARKKTSKKHPKIFDANGQQLHWKDELAVWPVDAAIIDLERRGLLSEPTMLDDTTWLASGKTGWNLIGQALSRLVAGLVWVSHSGVCVVAGSNRVRIVEPEMLKEMKRARACLSLLKIPFPGWGIGPAARAICRFIGEPAKYYDCCEHILEERPPGYHDCYPGTYPAAAQFDVSRYYFNLLSRLPGLRCYASRTELYKGEWSADDAARWRDVCEVICRHKLTANALCGVMLGKSSGARYWFRGSIGRCSAVPGPFMSAAIIVVGSGHELCREASEETDSVYSSTDSVLTAQGVIPATWRRVGLTSKFEAGGAAHIIRGGCYKIGNKPNVAYDAGCRYCIPQPRAAAPARLIYKEWL